MTASHQEELEALLEQAGAIADAAAFRRYESGRNLYHFNIDNAGSY